MHENEKYMKRALVQSVDKSGPDQPAQMGRLIRDFFVGL